MQWECKENTHTQTCASGLNNNRTSDDLYSRITVTFVVKTRGGWVDTWHIYNPASSLSIGFMCNRQLFGYWNVTLNRGSPVWVIFPTDNKENLSTVRRTHITYGVWKEKFRSANAFGSILPVSFPVVDIFVFRINESISTSIEESMKEKETKRKIGLEQSKKRVSFNKTQLICTFRLPLSELQRRCDCNWHR